MQYDIYLLKPKCKFRKQCPQKNIIDTHRGLSVLPITILELFFFLVKKEYISLYSKI